MSLLNLDEDRFLSIQAGAVELANPIREKVAELIAAGATDLHFVGSGGAGILMTPAFDLLTQRSTFPVYLDLPAELVLTGSARLGAASIVVIPSLSGTTAESIEALAFAKAQGATVITLTAHADSPLARDADATFTNFAEDDTSSESFYLQSYLFALAVMEARAELDDAEKLFAELRAVPAALLEVKRSFEKRAAAVAAELQDDEYHIITGSGYAWPEAWYYGMCILEEMQWVRTRPVHASDFFHGTLELVEKGISVLLFKGEDATRPLAERVEDFVPRVSDRLVVFDTADFALDGVGAQLRALLSPAVLATMMERLSAHLEVVRRHPLVVRRYYKRIAY